jgi:AcrR family transcriptional regulator
VGLGGLTIEGVAARSGVAKTTIYRHWSDRNELAFQSIESIMETPVFEQNGSLRADVVSALDHLVEGLREAPWAAVLPTMIDAAERDDDVLVLAREFAARRRTGLEQRLGAAVASGDLPGAADLDLLASQLVGPLFYRRFVSRQPISPGLVERHVDLVLSAVQRPTGR